MLSLRPLSLCTAVFAVNFSCQEVQSHSLSLTVVTVETYGLHTCSVALRWSQFSKFIFYGLDILDYLYLFILEYEALLVSSNPYWNKVGRYEYEKNFTCLWETVPLKAECWPLQVALAGPRNRESPAGKGVPSPCEDTAGLPGAGVLLEQLIGVILFLVSRQSCPQGTHFCVSDCPVWSLNPFWRSG